jgi:hypothetical protein
MSDFSKAYEISHNSAGGYVNDPNDTGGETYRDISRVSNPSWIGWPVIDAWKAKNGTPKWNWQDPELDKLAAAFYKQKFWNLMDLDNVVNQDNANQLFDETFDGPGRAVIMAKVVLNQLLGTAYPLNSSWNDALTKAVNKVDQKRFFDLYQTMRRKHFMYSADQLPKSDPLYAFYAKFAKPRPENAEYLKGWLGRVAKYTWSGAVAKGLGIGGVILAVTGLFFLANGFKSKA